MKARTTFRVLQAGTGVPVKMWTEGVPVEPSTEEQLMKLSQLPIIHHHVAAMPDVHLGIGATVGAVIPCIKAVIPAAVGVDIGCGMIAARTTLKASQLPDSLKRARESVEQAIPHGRTHGGGKGDAGAWRDVPERVMKVWKQHLASDYKKISKKPYGLGSGNDVNHLGTLGTGNHFIELCLDEKDNVWCMLHSGSRGVGNRIGSTFIEVAKKDMKKHIKNLPDADLAYLNEGTEHFNDYIEAVEWAQQFARMNRMLMMESFVEALREDPRIPDFEAEVEAVNCHHNYVSRETHFGESVYVTRKGALRAKQGELGIIPGSMGVKSYIVRGLGNPESFDSCSHGAGRICSRGEAKRRFSLEDHKRDTKGVECRKDEGVLDETPKAYKDIEQVMIAQNSLVEIVHTLKQVMCVKG